jgi:hypothetical protein
MLLHGFVFLEFFNKHWIYILALSHLCFLACQFLLLLHKNSIENALVLYISWIIICANCIFSLYTFHFAHSENDDECGDDLTTNGWIFNMPSFFVLLNCYSTSILFNNSASFSCLHLCSLLYVSFSFAIIYSFSIAFSTLMLPWILELRKCAQLLVTNANYFWWLPHFFRLWTSHPSHAFSYLPIFLINTWSSEFIQFIITS